MIISKTPYRISFCGGGTDYPEWFAKHGGAVLSTTIDKYCYLSVRYLPPYFDHKYRIVWSRIENVNSVGEIYHPAVRECLRFLKMKEGVCINHDGDLPAASGMGTSSTFTVGLLNSLHYLKEHRLVLAEELAEEAIYVEQKLVKSVVGNQDQVAAAIGGLNNIRFWREGFDQFAYKPLVLSKERKAKLENHLMLVFTGFPHNASDIASSYTFKAEYLKRMYQMVNEGETILRRGDMLDFGELLDEGWELKKQFSDKVTTFYLDHCYHTAKMAGAVGGKILGAGGGGFMLLFCQPEKQEAVKKALKGLLVVPFKLTDTGSQIISNGNGVT